MEDLPVDIRSIAEQISESGAGHPLRNATAGDFDPASRSTRDERCDPQPLRRSSVGDRLFARRCPSYYHKQLAQHAAMGFPGSRRLTNEIEVS